MISDTVDEREPRPFVDAPSEHWRVSGPLATTAAALFGNTSWFDNVVSYSVNMTSKGENNAVTWQRLCEGMPLGQLFLDKGDTLGLPDPGEHCTYDQRSARGFRATEDNLLNIRNGWLRAFVPQHDAWLVTKGDLQPTAMVESMLQIGLFAANRALLTFHSPNSIGSFHSQGRSIYSSDGQIVQKPEMSSTALIFLTILLGLQLLGLALLTYYIYHVPTWSVNPVTQSTL